MRVLLIEDEALLGATVRAELRAAGLAVDWASELGEADLCVTVNSYDCLIVDRRMPDGDGLDQVRAWRAAGIGVPVLVLTALDGVDDRVAGFELGADDYLCKPFAIAELVARVRSLARRPVHPRRDVVEIADLRVELGRRQVSRAGVVLGLSPKEFAVLERLALRADDAVSRAELLEHCWDEMASPNSNVLDVVVNGLRRKLGDPPILETVRGFGYRLQP